MKYNEIENIFYQDIREKKRAATGVYSRTGKRGYVGKMLFPSDLMSRKEKYRRNGKVTITNMYEKILTLDEFNELEDNEKRNRLQYWRSTYTMKKIMAAMGLHSNAYYKIIKDLGLPIEKRKKREEAANVKTLTAAIEQQPKIEVQAEAVIKTEPEPEPEPAEAERKCYIFNGSYTAVEIQKQLDKFSLILEDEPGEFTIELKISQKF